MSFGHCSPCIYKAPQNRLPSPTPQIKFTETDEGIRTEAKGEGIKGCLEACQKGTFSCCGFTKGQ